MPYRFIKQLFLLMFCGLNLNLVQADTVRVAVANMQPPYFLETSGTGLDVDIVIETLARLGHQAELVPVKASAMDEVLASGVADVVIPQTATSHATGALLSQPYSARNIAVFTLAERKLPLASAADLSTYRVVSFDGASRFVGDAFRSVSSGESYYSETPRHHSLVDRLFSERADVVVMDKYTFDFFKSNPRRVPTDRETTELSWFEPVPVMAGFASDELRISFDKALKTLKVTGRASIITAAYQ
ncbi:MAG: hypothetical protein CMI09_11570 [Oceanospirillaceae bacterium]|nr:hypothetical protein [Oceanospirillaceae bacterium]|tara:strand:+ start:5729 stop:6463 length:735 start_codon:yes stop_codon:yes gene_type:complete